MHCYRLACGRNIKGVVVPLAGGSSGGWPGLLQLDTNPQHKTCIICSTSQGSQDRALGHNKSMIESKDNDNSSGVYEAHERHNFV